VKLGASVQFSVSSLPCFRRVRVRHVTEITKIGHPHALRLSLVAKSFVVYLVVVRWSATRGHRSLLESFQERRLLVARKIDKRICNTSIRRRSKIEDRRSKR